MTTNNLAAIDKKLLGMPGGEKLKLLLIEQHGSVRGWARKNGLDSTEVYYTLNGQRPYPAIRKKLAKSLGLDLIDVDLLIDGAAV